jgi:hypothetical protein
MPAVYSARYEEGNFFDKQYPETMTIIKNRHGDWGVANPNASKIRRVEVVKTPSTTPSSSDDGKEQTVSETFDIFSTDGYMSQRQFAKLCRDAGLVKKDVTAEISFNRVKKIGSRKIDLREFLLALEDIATKKKMPLSLVEKMVADTEGPILLGTVPPKVKFHDRRLSMTQNARGEGEYDPTQYWQRDGRAKDWLSPLAHTHK